MSDGTVQRFNFGLCDEGCEVDCAHDEFVLASDYDALRTQARELAEKLEKAKESLDELLDDLDDGIRQELGTGGVSGATLVRARKAQAALKEGS